MLPKKFKSFHSSTAEDVMPGGLTAFLRALRQLPELQAMIFGQLHPQDLFHLYHICKAFSRFLRSYRNEPLWRRARENAQDVPDRPPFLSERAFARLLYYSHCHCCGKSAVREVNWAWYTRVCEHCLPQESYGVSDVQSRMQNWSKFLPLDDPLERLFDIYYPRPSSNDRKSRREDGDDDDNPRFYKRQVDDFLQQLPSPNTAFSYKALAEAREVVKKHAADIWERSMYRRDLQQWSRDWLGSNRDAALKKRREERLTEIVERLRESSWKGEAEYLDRLGTLSTSLSTHASVCRSIKLSEQEWLKLQDVLKPFLERIRQKRVDIYRTSFSNLGEAIASHCVQLPRNALMDCRPLFIDLALNEDVRALIEHPGTAAVSAAAFSSFIPSLVADWHAERKNELTEFFRRHLNPIPDGVDPLSLATAVFECHQCGEFDSIGVKVLRYPEFLAHGCPRCDLWSRKLPSPDEDLYANATMRLSPYTFHASDGLVWQPFARMNYVLDFRHKTEAIDCMRDIVAELGLDPSRATREDVQRCDARLQCLLCKRLNTPYLLVFTGEAAVSAQALLRIRYPPRLRDASLLRRVSFRKLQHALFHRSHRSFDEDNCTWERVSDEEMASAHVQEKLSGEWEEEHSLERGDVHWECSLCVDWSVNSAKSDDWEERLSSHLIMEHDIDSGDSGVQACMQDGTVYPHPGHGNPFAIPPVQIDI